MDELERVPAAAKIEATVGALGMVGGAVVGFVGVVVESVRAAQMWTANEVSTNPSRTGKEMILVGGLALEAGMGWLFRGLRDWR